MYLNTRIFPTTDYARVLLFVFIRRELGGTGTGCLFQFTYCDFSITKILPLKWNTVFRVFFKILHEGSITLKICMRIDIAKP